MSVLRILPSARKHGVSDRSIRHALENAMRRVDFDERVSLLIGPDATGDLLEVIVGDLDTDEARVIHALRLRPQFYRYL